MTNDTYGDTIMKRFKLGFALCILTLPACTGELESDDITLEDAISGSTYQQALHPNGDVDCTVLHDALLQHGIDPTLLEPEVVYQACTGSDGAPDDVCRLVATTCFGPQGCTDPHPPVPPQPPDDCQTLLDQLGADGNTDLAQVCMDQNTDPEVCNALWACLPPDGSGNPNVPPVPPDICQQIFDEAAMAGIDVTTMSADEALQTCLDHGYDPQLCMALIDACLPDGGATDPNGNGGSNTDPPNVDCDAVAQLLAEQGVMVPVDNADATDLYAQCVQQTNDDQLCAAALACVTP